MRDVTVVNCIVCKFLLSMLVEISKSFPSFLQSSCAFLTNGLTFLVLLEQPEWQLLQCEL